METSLAISNSVIRSYDDVQKAALAMSKSGFFQDARDASQAIVKILAGQELGFGAFASMTGVYIIQGRPSIGANLMAAAVKNSAKYDYRVTENSDSAVEITFFENGKEIGKSRFTREDAAKAQTKNMDKFPRNMLFARAMSNGVRWFCPDVFSGAAVYTPEELGADVDQDGHIIQGEIVDVTPSKHHEQPDIPYQAETPKMSLDMALSETTSKGEKYGDLDTEKLTAMANTLAKKPKDDDVSRKITAIQVILQHRAQQ